MVSISKHKQIIDVSASDVAFSYIKATSLTMCAIMSCFIAPDKAQAHGAWLGNCQIDYSGATLTQIKSKIDAGGAGIVDGDFIEVIADCPVIVVGTLSGPGGYVTFYKPIGTEIAGTWITNSAGTPINARPATSAVSGEGISRGWGPQGQKIFNITAGVGWSPSSSTACASAGFTAANCNAGMAYIYGDTGIFYSTRADTAMFTDGAVRLGAANGYLTDPSNAVPWTTVGGAGNERVHNKWDAVQTNAFGASSVIANGFSLAEETRLNTTGRGTTPFNAGSPVAGPDSGLQWDRYGTVGPWNRISYPGSCISNDPTIASVEGPANGIGSVVPQPAGGAINSVSVCTTTSFGTAVSDASLLPSATNAVRFAIGGLTSGERHYVKVRLKVTSVAAMGTINFESHGGDSTQGAAAGNDNPWRYWVGAPAITAAGSARLYVNKNIVLVNGQPYNGTTIPAGALVRYRIAYVSPYTDVQTNVVLSDVLPAQATATSNYAVISGPNIVPTVLPSSGTFNFQTIASLAPGQGGMIEFDVTTNGTVGQTVTNVVNINSTQLPVLQSDTVSATVKADPSADFSISKSNGTNIVYSGADTTYTVIVTNNGPDAAIGAVVNDVVGSGLNCLASNVVSVTGDGVPAGAFTISDLTGAGITLGNLAIGQSATLTYTCKVI